MIKAWQRAADLLYEVCAWGFALMAGVTAWEVFFRYVLRQPTIWATELTTLLCAFVFLVSGAFVMRTDNHLSITILSDIAPPWMKRILAVIKYVVILTFCVGLSWFSFESGWEPLYKFERAGTQWNPPTPAIIKPLILFIAFVMGVQATINLVRQLRAPKAAPSVDPL